MSDIVLPTRAAASSRLEAIRDWLRHARIAATLDRRTFDGLPDRLSRDIGADIGEGLIGNARCRAPAIDAPTRLGLLDLGWQPPRPARRR